MLAIARAALHRPNPFSIERFPGNCISIDRSVKAADVKKEQRGSQVQSLLFHLRPFESIREREALRPRSRQWDSGTFDIRASEAGD